MDCKYSIKVLQCCPYLAREMFKPYGSGGTITTCFNSSTNLTNETSKGIGFQLVRENNQWFFFKTRN